MQQKIAVRYVVTVAFFGVAAFLLAAQDWSPAAQEPHGQPTKAVPPVIETISKPRPAAPTAKRNRVRPQVQIQAAPSVPIPFADDTKSITGIVMDQQGEGLPGIRIIALPKQIFGHKNRRSAIARRQKTSSDAFGQYRFDRLAPGEYQIQAKETREYMSNRIFVRAGFENANLILSARQKIWVYGQVKSYRGVRLRDVQVIPNGVVSDSVYTDRNGAYGIYIVRQGDIHYPDRLRFSLLGYKSRQIRLPSVDIYVEQLPLRNVLLGRVYTPGFVTGVVFADDFPVAGAKVYLSSRDLKSHDPVVTDYYGSFEIRDLVTGRYSVRVVAGKQYQDYQESGLWVDALGSDLSIELKTLEFGQLTGQMVDPEGNPVPRFTLWMSSDSAQGRGSRPVTGDQQGFFSIDRVPYGDLSFRTRSTPSFRINAVRLTPHVNESMQLVVDRGPYRLAGQVIDSTGQPLPGTGISLTWERVNGMTTYYSVRNTMADRNGDFRFSRLSPDTHTLRFNVPEYKRRHRLDYKVGSNETLVVQFPPRSK